MRISLCLIARDEERMLPDCLASVAGAVDEIVLVDTGSTDRTRDLARRAGARVYEQPWREDFAAPRNEAARRATGDFILQLDCDERLAPGAGEALRRAADSARFDVGLLPLHHASRLGAPFDDVLSGRARLGAPVRLPRLLRRTPDLAWRGRVHECVTEWAARRGNTLRAVEAAIVHLGNAAGHRDERAKKERNVALLRRRCDEEPDDVTAFGYLAGELLAAGDRAEAERAAEAGWRLVRSQPEHRSVQRIGALRAALAWAAGDAERILETIEGVVRREELGADLRWLRAWALLQQAARAAGAERRRLGRRAAAAAAEARAPVPGLVSYDFIEGAAGWRSRLAGGEALLLAGQPADAEGAFRRALELRDGLREARLGLAEARLEAGDAAEALALVEPLLAGELGPDGWTLAAAAARALGSPGDAAVLLRRARERAGAGFAWPPRRERLARLGEILGPIPEGAGDQA